MSTRPLRLPTRFDYLLGVMGTFLAVGGVTGLVSSVPLYLAWCLGALLAGLVGVAGTLVEFV
jgi:hypothetical protein